MSNNTLAYLQLGASLYVPAIHHDLSAIAKGQRYPQLKSLIIDLEDALAESEVAAGYKNIRKLLLVLFQFKQIHKPLLFIRVRNVDCFKKILTFPGIEQIDGFVFPKFTTDNMSDYLAQCPQDYYCMPILEKDIFDINQLLTIRDYLLKHQTKILSLRLGITDLLAIFNLRRDCFNHLYDIGLIKHLMSQIMMVFKPAGFNISAPVYECIGDEYKQILAQEVKLDLSNGFFGKTIIHPWQIDVVQSLYQVSVTELDIAKKLLSPHSAAVFKLYGQMHEKATHTPWANYIVNRAEIYGVESLTTSSVTSL